MSEDEFTALQHLEGQRVRITFTDAQEVVATLISLSVDSDGRQHLLYDRLEWAALPHNQIGEGVFYAAGEEIVRLLPERAAGREGAAVGKHHA